MTDSNIVELINHCFEDPRNRKNIERFSRALWPHLYAILASINPDQPDLVEDAVQTAFLKFMEIFRKGRKPEVNYLAYFVAVAKNCLRDEHRKRRLLTFPGEEELWRLIESDSTNRGTPVEDQILMMEAMMHLNARCRYLLEKWYICGFSPAELAPTLGIAAESVYMLRKRCIENLRAVLNSC